MENRGWTQLWLSYFRRKDAGNAGFFDKVLIQGFDRSHPVVENALRELLDGAKGMLGVYPQISGTDFGDADRAEILLRGDESGNGSREIPEARRLLLRGDEPGDSSLKIPKVRGIQLCRDETLPEEGFRLLEQNGLLTVSAGDEKGLLYGVFAVLRRIAMEKPLFGVQKTAVPKCPLRFLNHWDNPDGTIERGYSGKSFFFRDGKILSGERIRDYARLASSVGVNAVVINNVNVRGAALDLITERCFGDLARLQEVLAGYGIALYLSLEFASPVVLGGLATADPLDPQVKQWWKDKMAEIFAALPGLGGFLVKADSEGRPGPFFYGRTQAEGANLLAEAAAPYGGTVVWRCFVYNCTQDWRDRKTDRARAGYDSFIGTDGDYLDNVILQIKNGPMDFQIREPVSPLLGGLRKTRQILEVQAAQEYTGQQIDLCYLAGMFSEILHFHTGCAPENDTVADVIGGRAFPGLSGETEGHAIAGLSGKPEGHAVAGQTDGAEGHAVSDLPGGTEGQMISGRTGGSEEHTFPGLSGGIAAVANTGDDANWTGNDLAAANFYAFGRLAFDPDLSPEQIAGEWIALTFGTNPQVTETLTGLLLMSRETYEKYTAPLGIGWMVTPNTHYGCSVNGYEYDRWGTYHRADHLGLGVNRSDAGTGYAQQYYPENAARYNRMETCPEELLLFFHHVPYTYVLKSGRTLIQHIYDTHFEGVEEVEEMIRRFGTLRGLIPENAWLCVRERFERQLQNAKDWRDQVNTYFYRMSGISDEKGRTIY